MRVIVAGCREFKNYRYVERKLDFLLGNIQRLEIVHGAARGVDSLGKRWGNERGHKVTPFPADWDANPRVAGFLRNQEMADYADRLVAFWDGHSGGTADMIRRAERRGLKIKIFKIVLPGP